MQPLATRMRPTSLSEVVGQQHLVGPGKVLRRMVDSGVLTSVTLYGPPGIGKTSIAYALAGDLGLDFHYFNAGVHGKKELQDIAKHGTVDRPVIVLIDEIHRLDKPKQDFLLMQLEQGSLVAIGATTENPYISMNPALRSRSHIFELQPVTPSEVAERLKTALTDTERGLGDTPTAIADDTLTYIAEQTGGDLRAALNTLELAVLSTPEPDDASPRIVDRTVIDSCLMQRQIGGDKDGDSHYNLLSAFQKSIRGSDADASLHYLARLIRAGDLVSIHRRLLVIAYEDIGLADPTVVNETYQAVATSERTGLPESRIPLAYITIRLALAPKSNVAYKALDSALAALDDGRDLSVPKHLKDAHYKGAAKLGNGVGYQYPHHFLHGFTPQQYLPDAYMRDSYLNFRDTTDAENMQRIYRNLSDALKPE